VSRQCSCDNDNELVGTIPKDGRKWIDFSRFDVVILFLRIPWKFVFVSGLKI
jgi:hypothetical protein